MDSIINELYYGNIRPVEQMGKLIPEVKAILRRMHENEDKLEESLNEQEKVLFYAIQDDRLEATCIIQEKRFREAFTLGARLIGRDAHGQFTHIIKTLQGNHAVSALKFSAGRRWEIEADAPADAPALQGKPVLKHPLKAVDPD